RFQHQQFQTFFAAAKLTHELLAINSTETAAGRRFITDYLNLPIWEDALHLIADELSAPSGFVGASDVARVSRVLIEGAATVDLVLAGTLAARCGDVVWVAVGQPIAERIRLWYRTNDPHHRRCALAAMV